MFGLVCFVLRLETVVDHPVDRPVDYLGRGGLCIYLIGTGGIGSCDLFQSRLPLRGLGGERSQGADQFGKVDVVVGA